MALPSEKQRVDHIHNSQHLDQGVQPLTEDEPSSIYEVKWRTLMAVFALSLSNVCAALANTVRRPQSDAA